MTQLRQQLFHVFAVVSAEELAALLHLLSIRNNKMSQWDLHFPPAQEPQKCKYPSQHSTNP
jgi:hypothetical protein